MGVLLTIRAWSCSARSKEHVPDHHFIASAWDVDLIISSDASAIFQTIYKDSVGPDEQLAARSTLCSTAVGRGYPYQIVTPVVYLSPSHNGLVCQSAETSPKRRRRFQRQKRFLGQPCSNRKTQVFGESPCAPTQALWFELALNGDSPNFGVLANRPSGLRQRIPSHPKLRATFASQDASKLFRLGAISRAAEL